MSKYENFYRPFKRTSLWNSQPINPVFGTYVIPPTFKPRGSTSKTFPNIAGGPFSTGIFRAMPTDGPMTIYKIEGTTGISDTDSLEFRPTITITHWPSDAVGASGGDGHCDIIDEEAGVIHSFWQLKTNAAGQFTAKQYSWSPLNGTGFGTGAHYSQGARAAGVATCAGMIRKHEINDGKPMYEHALACSMDYTGLSNNPPFISPATMSDWDYQYNTGGIPEGALIMLPPSYDTSRLDRWPHVKKVAETLKVFGARVVDRNEYTPYYIYVENYAGWQLTPTWDNALVAELEYIRTELRQVVSQDGFLAGQEDEEVTVENMLSLRGNWVAGASYNLYDSLAQGIRVPVVAAKTWFVNSTGLGFRLAQFKPVVGGFYRMKYETTNKSYFRMNIKQSGKADVVVAPPGPGQYVYVKWPGGWHEMTTVALPGDPAGLLTASFEKVTEAEYQASALKL